MCRVRLMTRIRAMASARPTSGTTLLDRDFRGHRSRLADRSSSQLGQDILALLVTKWRRGGVFAEVGVGDGTRLSNTLMLERDYGWTGILIEPNPETHAAIAASRTAILDRSAACGEDGRMLEFLCATEPDLSTITRYANCDYHNRSGRTVRVDGDRLGTILERNGIGALDFLSVDTEGSEREILSVFDFARYAPALVTVEHNCVPEAEAGLDALLGANGYDRVLRRRSKCDDVSRVAHTGYRSMAGSEKSSAQVSSGMAETPLDLHSRENTDWSCLCATKPLLLHPTSPARS